MIRVLALLACLFIAGCDDEEAGGKKDTSIQSITLADGTVIEGKDLVVKMAACAVLVGVCLLAIAGVWS